MAAAGGEGFVVRVLDECGETWEETEDIGDAAVLLDAAGSVAASTMECSLASLPLVFPVAGRVVPGPSGEERGRQGYRRSFSLWC